MFCINCGTEISDSDKINNSCSKCDATLSTHTQQQNTCQDNDSNQQFGQNQYQNNDSNQQFGQNQYQNNDSNQQFGQNQYQNNNTNQQFGQNQQNYQNQYNSQPAEKLGVGFALGFFLSAIGILIALFLYNNEYERKSCIKGSVIGVIVSTVIGVTAGIIYFIFLMFTLGTIGYY